MKKSLVVGLLVGVALLAAMVIQVKRKEAPPAPPPVAEQAQQTPVPPAPGVPDKEPVVSLSRAGETAPASVAIPTAQDAAPDRASNPAPQSTPFSRAIGTLVSPQATFQQKHEAWKELQESGQLERTIEALKQGAAENPTSATYPAALGQAQLYRAGEIAQNGGTVSEMGILGLQADQNFDAALKLDPANWEAQFFKATAMSHWPPELNKGEEVIQRLSGLIGLQDGQSPQPQFAQTYVVLGDQYQKMGQPEHALATWLIGAQKFPGNPELQQKIRGN